MHDAPPMPRRPDPGDNDREPSANLVPSAWARREVLVAAPRHSCPGPDCRPRGTGLAFAVAAAPASGRTLGQEESSVIKVLPGVPYPLGATWDGQGTNFA